MAVPCTRMPCPPALATKLLDIVVFCEPTAYIPSAVSPVDVMVLPEISADSVCDTFIPLKAVAVIVLPETLNPGKHASTIIPCCATFAIIFPIMAPEQFLTPIPCDFSTTVILLPTISRSVASATYIPRSSESNISLFAILPSETPPDHMPFLEELITFPSILNSTPLANDIPCEGVLRILQFLTVTLATTLVPKSARIPAFPSPGVSIVSEVNSTTAPEI